MSNAALGTDPISSLVMSGASQTAKITDALTGGRLERTIDGASSLTLDLIDPSRALLTSDICTAKSTLTIAGHVFQTVSVSKSGDSVSLTFEDEVVARLRTFTKFRKAVRGKVTRAQFVRSLCSEAGVTLAGPETATALNSRKTRQAGGKTTPKKEPGFADGAQISVQGSTGTPEQRRNTAEVLKAAWVLTAKLPSDERKRALTACVMCINQESGALNDSTPDANGDYGLFQMRGDGSYRAPMDIAISTDDFLNRAPGRPAFLKVARSNSGKSVGWMVSETQRDYTWGTSGQGKDYDRWHSEAEKTVASWLGDAPLTTAGGGGKYEFTRGQPKQPEDSWTAMQRLASEVKWRCFVVDGVVWFIDDGTLMTSQPVATLSEGIAGVDWIDFEFDTGQQAAEATVQCMAGLWDVPPGSVVKVADSGPADGRWLVSGISRELHSPVAEIRLTRPSPALAEPKGDTSASRTIASDGSGTLRDQVVAWAKWASAHRSKFTYAMVRNGWVDIERASHITTDCSGLVTMVFKKAGAPDPNGSSYNGQGSTVTLEQHGRSVSSPRPGDLIIYGPKGASGSSGHVQIYLGSGKDSVGFGDLSVKAYDYRSDFRFVDPFGGTA